MKKNSLLIISIIIITAVLTQCGKKQPQKEYKKTVHWGEVFAGQTKSHTFKITNTYDKTMKIGYIRPDCPACTTFEIEKTELEPGETVDFEVGFDSAGYEGKVEYRILVYHNLSKNGRPIIFKYSANVKNLVKSSTPLIINFGSIKNPKNNTGKQTLTLNSKVKNKKIKIEKISFGKYKFLDYKITRSKKGGKKVVLKVYPKKVLKQLDKTVQQTKEKYKKENRGKYTYPDKFFVLQENQRTRFVVPVKIYINFEKQPYLRFVATGTFVSGIQTSLKNNILVFDDILKHISKGIDFTRKKTFTVFSKNKSPFRIKSVESDNELLNAEIEKISAGKYNVIVHFNKDKATLKRIKSNKGNILIETNDPFARLIRVKIEMN